VWRVYGETRRGLAGWKVIHDDGRPALEWTNARWLADDVANRLNEGR